MRYHQFATILAENAPVPGQVPGLTKEEVINVLTQMGYEDVKPDGSKLKVLVQIPDGEKKTEYRTNVMGEILVGLQKAFRKFNPQHIKASKFGSQGGIVFDNSPIAVLVKDVGSQGDQSAGVANELELAAMITSVIEKFGSASVTFVDPRGKKMSIKNCTSVEVAGRDTANRKKADVVLKSKNGSLPISIKKMNADMWESADSLFGSKAKSILEKLQKEGAINLIPMSDDTGRKYFKLSKEIVVEPSEKEAMDAIFGSDLTPQGGVVIQTFKPEHYEQLENTIKVDCHSVITKKEDIPESHLMVWLIRNNEERNNPLPGLRTLGVTLTRGIGKKGTKDVVLVDRHGNVVENPNKAAVKPKMSTHDSSLNQKPKMKRGSEEATRELR